MRKGYLGLLAAGILSAVLTLPVMAAPVSLPQQALAAAQVCVPAGSELQGTEEEKTWFEVRFYNAVNKEWYEVEIDKATGSVVTFESDTHLAGGVKVIVTQAAAEQRVIAEIKDAGILESYLDDDDGRLVYKVKFESPCQYGEYEIHPESGSVIKRDIHFVSVPLSATQIR